MSNVEECFPLTIKDSAHTTWQVPGAAVTTGPGAAVVAGAGVVVATVSGCEKLVIPPHQ